MERIHDQPKRATEKAQRTPGRAPGHSPLMSESGPGLAPAHPMTPADIMMLQRTIGNRAVTRMLAGHPGAQLQQPATTIQRRIDPNKLNIVGEHHDESGDRRADEKAMVLDHLQFPHYWEENEFAFTDATDGGTDTKHGDSLTLLVLQSMSFVASEVKFLERRVKRAIELLADPETNVHDVITTTVRPLKDRIGKAESEVEQLRLAVIELEDSGSTDDDLIDQAGDLRTYLKGGLDGYLDEIEDYLDEIKVAEQAQAAPIAEILARFNASIGVWNVGLAQLLQDQGYDLTKLAPTSPGEQSAESQLEKQIVGERSLHMYIMAEEAAEKAHITGVWKIGNEHVDDLQHLQGPPSPHVAITGRGEFNTAYEAWKKPKVEGQG